MKYLTIGEVKIKPNLTNGSTFIIPNSMSGVSFQAWKKQNRKEIELAEVNAIPEKDSLEDTTEALTMVKKDEKVQMTEEEIKSLHYIPTDKYKKELKRLDKKRSRLSEERAAFIDGDLAQIKRLSLTEDTVYFNVERIRRDIQLEEVEKRSSKVRQILAWRS